MREYLFKGKRKDNGEWVEGSGINTQYDIRGEKHIYIGVLAKSELYPLMQTIIWYEVIPETVGQYTGLTDKNGKKIFEGNIVKFANIVGVINFKIGCFCVRTNKPDWKNRNNPTIDIVLSEYENEIEVIGNIHDDPELLEVR